jgi:hypothetical protein
MPRGTGAYGLRLTGMAGASELLLPAPETWSDWRIERLADARPGVGSIGDDRAVVSLSASGSLVIDRATATATIASPSPPDDRELVHPYLAAVAAVAARWDGNQSFHCGGLVTGDGAWGVLGGREQGKSTLLAALERRGASILSDDLLVIRDGTALAGPRCVDLRADAATALDAGERIGIVGARERWRVRLRPVVAEAPVRGWVVLRWGSGATVRPVPPAERLPLLLEHATIGPDAVDPGALLDLAALPMLAFERPRRFDAVAETSDMLLDSLAARETSAT